jgi:hypothetical protein
MLSRQSNKQTKENKQKDNFKLEGVILSILSFINSKMSLFIINKEQVNLNKIESSYNSQLSMFLNAQRSMETFLFQNSPEQENGRVPDIGVYTIQSINSNNYESIFDIECKRLNTQLSHVKQYVSGNTGGIQRFKLNQHGVNLPYSAMIGYVENQTSEYWVEQINTWITNLSSDESGTNGSWSVDDCLKVTDKQYYISNHNRLKGSIRLYHFFKQIF